jgi:hypothetical protein
MNCSSINSSINHENLNYNASDQFKQSFSGSEEEQLSILEKKLNTYKGEINELKNSLYYNYFYTMFYMLLFIILFSLLFTSYFSVKSNNSYNRSSNISSMV